MKALRLIVVAGIAAFLGLSGNEQFVSRDYSVVSVAEAVVGRPLTPVSGAGVARRTVRRCAAGVYNC